MRLYSLTVLALLVPLALTAHADILLLEGGGRVEGEVTATAEGYRVEAIHGTAFVKKHQVLGRIEVPYVTEIHRERLARIARDDHDALFELAVWCERNGLTKEARRHLEDILILAPDHELTRRKLGYVRFEGAWMWPEEAQDARMARAGFIPFEGRWFTERGLAAYLAAKKEMALLEKEAEARREEREAAERKARLEEERIARDKAEREALERAMAMAEEDRRERERLERENQDMRDLVRDLLDRDRWDPYYSGGIGIVGYGYSWPSFGYGGRGFRMGPCPAPYTRGGIGFSYNRGNVHVRGRVR